MGWRGSEIGGSTAQNRIKALPLFLSNADDTEHGSTGRRADGNEDMKMEITTSDLKAKL